jgi:RNA polymerase sigma-70 factor (ECF subfamily)
MTRYRNQVYRICYRSAGNTEDAEDWTQECFLRLFRQLKRYRPDRPFRPWLMRVISNVCINQARARLLRRNYVPLDTLENYASAVSDQDPERSLLAAERRRAVQAALASLSPTLQETVLLRVCEDLSFREIAEVQKLPLQTAATRVRRALSQVRKRLHRDYGEMMV